MMMSTDEPSLKLLYQRVCEDERRASLRNTALIKDLARLSHQLSVAADAASHHATRLATLKCQYHEAVVSTYTGLTSKGAETRESDLQREASSRIHYSGYHGNIRQPDSLTKAAYQPSELHQDISFQAIGDTLYQDRPVQAINSRRPIATLCQKSQNEPVQTVSTVHQDTSVQVSTVNQDTSVQVNTAQQDTPVQAIDKLHQGEYTDLCEVDELLTTNQSVDSPRGDAVPFQGDIADDCCREQPPATSDSLTPTNQGDPLEDFSRSESPHSLELLSRGQGDQLTPSPPLDSRNTASEEEKQQVETNDIISAASQHSTIASQHSTCSLSESHDDPSLDDPSLDDPSLDDNSVKGSNNANTAGQKNLLSSKQVDTQQDNFSITGRERSHVKEQDIPSTIVSGQEDSDLSAIVVNLLRALNTDLFNTAESAHLMYIQAKDSDSMKQQITSSDVLASRMISAASQDGQLVSWDVSAMSAVTLQQLALLSHSLGGLMSDDSLQDDSALLNGPEEMKLVIPEGWQTVWNVLLEHLHLLHRCGRSFNDLVAVFIPSLIPNESLREKARLQLLCVLQSVNGQSTSSEEDSKASSQTAEGVFEDLSLHSSLLSEGSAMEEIERELALQDNSTPRENDSSFIKTPPILLSLSGRHGNQDEDSSDNSSLTPFSPSYVPTAIEQTSAPLKASLKRRLGFHGDSDSDIDDLPVVTPLAGKNHLLLSDREDFDF